MINRRALFVGAAAGAAVAALPIKAPAARVMKSIALPLAPMTIGETGATAWAAVVSRGDGWQRVTFDPVTLKADRVYNFTYNPATNTAAITEEDPRG